MFRLVMTSAVTALALLASAGCATDPATAGSTQPAASERYECEGRDTLGSRVKKVCKSRPRTATVPAPNADSPGAP